jgi:hypothetical protein
MNDPAHNLLQRRRRQKRTVTALAGLLIAGGLAVLFLLPQIPLPMRLMIGIGDLFAGLVLLVLVQQNFRG